MTNDIIKNMFKESSSIETFKADVMTILSKVHLVDGMDFSLHLFKTANCDKYFELPDDIKPKVPPMLIGRIIDLEQYVATLDDIINKCSSKTEIQKILDVLKEGDHSFANTIADKLLFLTNQASLEKGPTYAMCLLSTSCLPFDLRELCGDGIVELLIMTISKFHNQAHEIHHMLCEKHDYLLYKAQELNMIHFFGREKRKEIENFTEEYAALSKQFVMASLLANSIPHLEEIYCILKAKATDMTRSMESMGQYDSMMFHYAESRPKKFKFRPDASALFEEKEPLKYVPCHDGFAICGGSLFGSGFIDFTTGITLPCEIYGSPVTEFSGTYEATKLQHIEAWCIKRVNLKLQGEADMICEPPLLYGGMQDTIESTSLTFEAPTMHYGRFEDRKDITYINFSGVVTAFSDWGCSHFTPYAFKGCTKLSRVDGILEGELLDEGTFENCASMISAPKLNVKIIGDDVFRNCSSLKTVSMKDGLKTIASGVFAGCSSIEDLYIPDTCLRIGRGTFKNCISLKAIHLPNSLDEISADLFYNCESLTKVFLSDSIICIGDNAFYNCKSLKNPWIPQSIKKIGTNAFYGCVDVKEITIPEGIEEIGDNAFGGIPNLVIKGYQGTVAEMYAKEHDLCFIPIAPASDNPKTEYDLSRFTEAHKRDFESAFAEIESGKKKTHWMWYIFPQISGLGKRDTAVMYSIKDINEAKAFLDDKYLGGNLRKICEVLLKLPIDNAEIIFGPTDAKKLKSSMTLFLRATNDNTIFKAVLDKFFDGNQDYLTVNILNHN